MKSIYLLIISLGFSFITQGQALNGTINDENKSPISGVNILNISNGKHTHSNEKGFFSLEEFKIGDTLQFSHIAYQETRLIVNSSDVPLKILMVSSLIDLEEIVISRGIDALNVISDIDIQTNPVNSSQDVLRRVPGLFIGQHAGGGKAEQIFLRGFDIDHGTDINLTVDGIPVNMVSHAHGQGYSDLHFVIPETIDKLDFGKGPYYANKGNFNTAGYVDFKTKDQLDNNTMQLEIGQFNTYRLLSMLNLLDHEHHNSYFAAEYINSDGPFESPQNFSRVNLFGKYTGSLSQSDKIGMSLSYFSSLWDASGQIPQRSVDDGSISRFGAIDNTEGGNTSRMNASLNYSKFIDQHSFIKNQLYFSRYDFELYSNFTFFLMDSINGDQIKQKEDRNIFGLNSEYNRQFSLDRLNGSFQVGVNFRSDQSRDNELSHTLNRKETLEQFRLGDINESNMGAYINSTFEIGKWTFNPSIRLDYFDFQYNDELQVNYETESLTKSIISPKLNILYNYSKNLQVYVKSGKGFHSNDTRVVVEQSGEKILPDALGYDLGFIWKPRPQWLINAAYWHLLLEQEFVYVGDAGIVEPSGETLRRGVDFSLRYQALDWLFFHADVNYAHARATQELEGQDFIPLAPDLTIVSGLSARHKSGFYGSTNLRFIDDRPANEDNSIVAEGYSVVDLNLGYVWSNYDFGIQIQNLFDVDWNETQFATESRLLNEQEPVEEIHFTPGTPFFIKGVVKFKF